MRASLFVAFVVATSACSTVRIGAMHPAQPMQLASASPAAEPVSEPEPGLELTPHDLRMRPKTGYVITGGGAGGGGGGFTGSGTSGRIPRLTGSTALGNGSFSDDGSNHITLANTSGYGIAVTPSGTDADNRGFQCSSTWTGATGVAYCYHGLMAANSAVVAYAAKLGCTNAGSGGCRALELSDGDFFANTQSGITQINGTTTFAGAQVNIGKGGSNNTNLYEKHNTSPTLAGASCTGTGSSVTGGTIASTIVVGTTATACDYTFATAYTSPPTCTVTPLAGATVTVGAATTTKLALTGLTNSGSYNIICIGH